MRRSIEERVAGVTTAAVAGTFFRHAAPNRDAFAGGVAGRWGRSFPVIYLALPVDAAIVEAYRHLVEDAGVPAELIRPRRLYIVTVDVDTVLDLTAPGHAAAAGLTDMDLRSDVEDYDACQEVAQAAHDLELRGILAPSATGIGQTLALFRTRITATQLPIVQSEETWEHLPPDPRVPPAVAPGRSVE